LGFRLNLDSLAVNNTAWSLSEPTLNSSLRVEFEFLPLHRGGVEDHERRVILPDLVAEAV
jgi:hypothetical protein